MMDLKAYRFDGIHLEPIEGAHVAGATIHRTADRHTIRTALHGQGHVPMFAIVFVDIVLERGEHAGVHAKRSDPDEVRCDGDAAAVSLQRMLLIAPGTEVTVGVHRRGGSIVTRLRNNDGALTIVSQDKPAGC